ncbi:alpha/beta hydrolase [Micromonospora purpureochromogenes]|uniref:alpha/beta hydrolase n=1 Tax=Micromonospora purpureochromogenes TaxID=47872 RepID=UPI00363C418D
MSTLGLHELLTTNTGSLHQATSEWKRLAEDLDNAAESYIRGTRDLDHAWPEGPASENAHAKVASLRREMSNAYQPARTIVDALDHHAYAVGDLQQQARGIIDGARADGYLVDETTGRVTARARDTVGGSLDADLRAVQSYADQLATVVERARALDEQTAAVLRQNLPDRNTGFGEMCVRDITRPEVEQQRGRSPEQVAEWWNGLTPEQQEQILAQFPDIIGQLDGVPTTDRDTANRAVFDGIKSDLQRREDDLNQRIADLLADPTTDPDEQNANKILLQSLHGDLADLDAEQARLAKVDSALTNLGDRGYLLGIDTAGDGKAIIAVGNPDTARHTAVWVPGLGTTLDSTRGNVERVLHLQEAADRLTPGQAGDVATVMWLGYDAPETDLSVALEERSRQGAGPLLRFVDGLHATHADGQYHVTAVGHSYGSTVVGEAALIGQFRVDDIVTAGSPGTHAQHADQLIADPRHVWAGSANDDPVSEPVNNPYSQAANAGSRGTLLGGAVDAGLAAYDHGHGPSPHYDGFGANRYTVDTHGHSDYWNEDSVSIRNQARVIMGKYSLTQLDHGQRPPDLAIQEP